MEKKIKLLIGVTISKSLGFYEGHIEYLKKNNIEVEMLSSGKFNKNVKHYSVDMQRDISILQDIKSFIRILKVIGKSQPNIINYGTPKASLLLSIAAKIKKVRSRIYTCHGLRYETLSGFKRKLLIYAEKIIIANSTRVLCVSESVKESLVDISPKNRHKIEVIYKKGSCNGVDIEGMNKKQFKSISNEIRKDLKIPNDDFIFLFVGRITQDKGINELIKSFELLHKDYQDIHLLICGNNDQMRCHELDERVKKLLDKKQIGNMHYLGRQNPIEPYFHLSNALVVPTHREGFGNVFIEAAASKKPSITCNVTGAKDAVINERTGLLVSKGSIIELKGKMRELYLNREKATRLGEHGFYNVTENYDRKSFYKYYLELYENMYNSTVEKDRGSQIK